MTRRHRSWLSRLDPRRSLRVRLCWAFALLVVAPLSITTLAGMTILQQRLEQSVRQENLAALAEAAPARPRPRPTSWPDWPTSAA